MLVIRATLLRFTIEETFQTYFTVINVVTFFDRQEQIAPTVKAPQRTILTVAPACQPSVQLVYLSLTEANLGHIY